MLQERKFKCDLTCYDDISIHLAVTIFVDNYLLICLMSLLFTYLLISNLHHEIWLVARSALFERIRRQPCCLQAGHTLFNFIKC